MSDMLFPIAPRAMDGQSFLQTYGGVYEHSCWVAEALWQAGLSKDCDTVTGLATAMAGIVDSVSGEQRRTLIKAHPDLAGRAALAGELTAHSNEEQASAGIDQCTPEEFERFQSFNTRYREQFGFPFVMAVRGSDKREILAAFERRLRHDAQLEFDIAIAEVHKIAKLRLIAIATDQSLPEENPVMTKETNPFATWVDLAQPRLGSRVVYATDDFFADKARLIDPLDPVFIEGKFDENGKWMDGWESRRKRVPGYDYCIVRLGVPGVIHGFDIDTSHFTGNFPPAASIDACLSHDAIPGDDAQWLEIVPRVGLAGNSHHFSPVSSDQQFTHVRLNIFPDGGVARLRVYGEIAPDWSRYESNQLVDLVALENGGRALACNDEHFGSMKNLNAPGRGANMGDGWETARRRTPGNDWVLLALGHPGRIRKIVVDTAHFKGNYPDKISMLAGLPRGAEVDDLIAESTEWPELLTRVSLGMDAEHEFTAELIDVGVVSHVRINIYPDGGLSRIRLFGYIDRQD